MNLINTLRMYAEDMHSAAGYSERSSAMSKAADYIERLEKELAEWKNMSACEACATIPSVMEYVQQLEQERDQLKEDYQRTCHLVAQMHMAAMNGVIGPKRGVIEDIADLLEERDQLAAQNDAMRQLLNKIHDIAAPYDDGVKFGYIKELALEGLNLPKITATGE